MNQRQDEGIQAWTENNYIGTLNMAVGTGKTITSFKAILRAFKDGKLQAGDTIRFMAETDARWITIEREMDVFFQQTGLRMQDKFKFVYECYQGVPPWPNSKMDIYDEIHMALTEKYHQNLLQSKAELKLGLSATIPENQTVFVSEWPDEMRGKIMQSQIDTDNGEITTSINKGQLIKIVCPIVYRYDIEMAVRDEVISTFETYIVYHDLDDTYRTYEQKFGKVTEKKMYEIWLKAMRKGSKSNDDDDDIGTQKATSSRAKMFLGHKMTNFLYSVKSKQILVSAMVKLQDRPTIIFSVIKDPMRSITKNVAEGNVVKMVKAFNEGQIRTIGTSKKLKQGITLEGVENGIMMSYTSKSWELLQQLGRIVRWAPGKKAKLFIIVTRGTLEEKWFREMTKMYSENLNLLGLVSLNIVGYIDGKSIIQQYQNQKNGLQ